MFFEALGKPKSVIAKEEETVVETTAEIEVTPAAKEYSPDDPLIAFEYNEDGTVNESNIEWSKYSKNQRKEIRAQINAHNATVTTK